MEAAHCSVVWNCSVQLNDIFMFKAVNGVFSVRLRRSGLATRCFVVRVCNLVLVVCEKARMSEILSHKISLL